MLNGSFPSNVDWRKLSQQQAKLQFTPELAEFERLSVAVECAGDEAPLLTVEFLRDEQRRYYLKGSVSASVQLLCQRCMHALPYTISGDFQVYIVMTEDQQKALPKQLDSVLAEDEQSLDLKALFEDELLLQLPFTIYHNEGDCDDSFKYENTPEPEIKAAVKENPFAVLNKLTTSDIKKD